MNNMEESFIIILYCIVNFVIQLYTIIIVIIPVHYVSDNEMVVLDLSTKNYNRFFVCFWSINRSSVSCRF